MIYGNSHFSASSSKTIGNNDNQGARVSLADDKLIIQARHLLMTDGDDANDEQVALGNNYKEPLAPVSLDNAILSHDTSSLNSPNGIKNVKRIRSPNDDDLRIESVSSNLILSGNLGVKSVAVESSIESNDVRIFSRDSEIVIASHLGVQFPLLSRCALDSEKFQLPNNDYFQDNISRMNLYQTCVCRNGRMFKIRKRDESESCTEAKFPISANPCL